MKRKFLAWLLTFAMVFNMALPYTAFAEDMVIDTDGSYSVGETDTNNDNDATDDVDGDTSTADVPTTDDEQEPAVDEPAADGDNDAESAGKEVSEPAQDEPAAALPMMATLGADEPMTVADVNTFDITIPSDAAIYLQATHILGTTVTNVDVEPVAVVQNSNSTTTYRFKDQGSRSCIFRVSGENYIAYAGSVFVNAGKAMTVTRDMLQPAGKTCTMIDRNVASHGGVNVAGMYMNVNPAGYLKMDAGQKYQFSAMRDWWLSNVTWTMTIDKKCVQPDYHYTVLDLAGNPSDSVISIDDNGMITAKGNGDAIVLVSYDSITVNYPDEERETGSYDANGFWGACWPENTGVFVVSVGAGESGIKTGATITQPKQDTTTGETVTRAIDSEYDVIYFAGDKGEYSFTPETEGVTVSVANSVISDKNKAGTMSFNGFVDVKKNADGSFAVPLVEGKNIIKVAKDGKAEYQVITAKHVDVTVNGMPLDKCGVCAGDNVIIEFSQMYNPQNRNQYVNSDAGLMYQNVGGLEGKTAGNASGPYGNYGFVSSKAKHTIERWAKATRETSSGYNNPVIALEEDKISVPENYSGTSFDFTNGSFNIVGFGDGVETFRSEVGGFVTEGGNESGEEEEEGKLSNALFRWLGQLPDIKIPVVTPEKITVTTQPDKTVYKLNEEFSTDGMVVKVTYSNGAEREITDYTCSKLDSATTGEKAVTVSYTAGGVTKTADVNVEVTDLSVTSIEVTKLPTKLVYKIGEKFAPAGMEVTAHYSNGNSKVLESGEYTYDTTPFDNRSAKVNVEVKAAGFTTTVEVSIDMVVKLELDTSVTPPSSEYTVGSKVNNYYIKRTSGSGLTNSIYSNIAMAFESSPFKRPLTAYDDKYAVTAKKTVSMAFQKNYLGIAGLEPLIIPITVKDETNNKKIPSA